MGTLLKAAKLTSLAVIHHNAAIVSENHLLSVAGCYVRVKTFTGFRVHVYKITRLPHPYCVA